MVYVTLHFALNCSKKNYLNTSNTLGFSIFNYSILYIILVFLQVSLLLSAFLFFKPEAVPAIFRDVTEDHQRMFDIIKASGLKWVAILPPHITGMCRKNEKKAGSLLYFTEISLILYVSETPKSKYVVTFDSSPGRVISKHDLGAFLIECLMKPEYYQKICGIANTS